MSDKFSIVSLNRNIIQAIGNLVEIHGSVQQLMETPTQEHVNLLLEIISDYDANSEGVKAALSNLMKMLGSDEDENNTIEIDVSQTDQGYKI